MYENKRTHNGIRYSRYIASWKNVGGKIYRSGLFEQWLREVEQLTDEEIGDIMLIAENGKAELEWSAEKFLNEHVQGNNLENKLANTLGIEEGSDLNSKGVTLKMKHFIEAQNHSNGDEILVEMLDELTKEFLDQ